MNWFVSKIIFQIISGNGDHRPQFDEQLRLIQAENEMQAFEKAVNIGRVEEQEFINTKHDKVYWKFINISELYLLPDLRDGIELHYTIHEVEDGDYFISCLNYKASQIQKKLTEA
jgi:hypothetical protein